MSKFQSYCRCAYCGCEFVETFEFSLTETCVCPDCGRTLEWGDR